MNAEDHTSHRQTVSTTSGSFQARALALRLRRLCTLFRIPLRFQLPGRPSLSLCNLTDPEDRSNQTPLPTRGGFRNHLGHLFSSTEEEECRVIQACMMAPVDSTMSFIEMAIGYACTQDYAVCQATASFMPRAVHVVWLPSTSGRVPASLRPDQPPAALGTPTSLPVPCSFDNRVSEFHRSAPLLPGNQGSIQQSLGMTLSDARFLPIRPPEAGRPLT